ncbi:hypothetical protein Tco_0202288, partial [Tanacetum coccineum]
MVSQKMKCSKMMSDHNSSDVVPQRQMVSAENNTSGPFKPQSSMFKWCLLKITLQAPFLNVQKMFDRSRSSLGLHRMTSDHNRSELEIQDHNNEQSSSKLVP